jgi:DNA-binding protein Fis
MPSQLLSQKGSFPTLKEVEEFIIAEAMQRTGGNQTLASQLLGVAQSTLSRRFKGKDPRN